MRPLIEAEIAAVTQLLRSPAVLSAGIRTNKDTRVSPALTLSQQDVILSDDNVPVLTYHSVDLPGGEGKVAGAARGRALVVLLHDGAEQLTLPQPAVPLRHMALVLLVEFLRVLILVVLVRAVQARGLLLHLLVVVVEGLRDDCGLEGLMCGWQNICRGWLQLVINLLGLGFRNGFWCGFNLCS